MRKRGYILFRHVETENSEMKTAEIHTEVLEINGKNYVGFTCPVCKQTIAVAIDHIHAVINASSDTATKSYLRRKVE